MNINKTYYSGVAQGEVVCIDCAGVALKASIENAVPNQINFYGALDVYSILSKEEVAELAEYDVTCYCKAGK